jgi:anti-sigma regulatory factor (Ser/Thr protein kinase)
VSDDAQLLTSELVSNAVRHASSSIAVSAVVDEGALLVIVTDDGPGDAHLTASLPDAEEETGRGMYVVSEIAGAWGSNATSVGMTTWFRLDAARR